MKIDLTNHPWKLIGLIGLDIIFFTTSNATRAPSYMVIVAIALLSLTLYFGVYELIGYIKSKGIAIRQHSLALYMTLVVGGLIALQSIGQLSSRDVLVLLPLSLLGYMYSAYAKSIRRDLNS